MNRQQYASYMRSREWREKKLEYRASSLPQRCVVCGNPQVDLHHRTYARLGHERLADLVPLCREHHQEAHRIRAGIDERREAKKKKPLGSCSHSPLATAKQLAYIVRLGGSPNPEMTNREARGLTAQLQKRHRRTR